MSTYLIPKQDAPKLPIAMSERILGRSSPASPEFNSMGPQKSHPTFKKSVSRAVIPLNSPHQPKNTPSLRIRKLHYRVSKTETSTEKGSTEEN